MFEADLKAIRFAFAEANMTCDVNYLKRLMQEASQLFETQIRVAELERDVARLSLVIKKLQTG